MKGWVTPPSTLARYVFGSAVFTGGLAVSASFSLAYGQLGVLALFIGASGMLAMFVGMDLLRIRVTDHATATRQTWIFYSSFALSLVLGAIGFPLLQSVLPLEARDGLRWVVLVAVVALVMVRLTPQMRRGLGEIWAERS